MKRGISFIPKTCTKKPVLAFSGCFGGNKINQRGRLPPRFHLGGLRDTPHGEQGIWLTFIHVLQMPCTQHHHCCCQTTLPNLQLQPLPRRITSTRAETCPLCTTSARQRASPDGRGWALPVREFTGLGWRAETRKDGHVCEGEEKRPES